MIRSLAWLQPDEGTRGLVLFLIFVVAPLVLRLVRWLLVRAGVVQPTPEEGAAKSEARRERRAPEPGR